MRKDDDEKWVLCYHLPCTLYIFKNVFTFLYVHVTANSKEICEKISLPSFFGKMLSAFLLRSTCKANYLEKMGGYPYFSLWIPIALTKINFFCMVLIWHKNLCI